MSLQVFNTLTKKKEPFQPIEPGKVSMYVCGVTVYDYCHVGHARCYVAFDVVQRWLRANYELTFVRNFTDVDDKIIRRANETGEDPIALASRFVDAFHEDMDALGVQKADEEPRVSEVIDDIANFVNVLVEKEFAYRVPADTGVEGAGDDVYFRVRKFPTYTDLSGRNLEDMRSGARVDVDDRKEDPLDFALWKAAKPGEISWGSPFGQGRPGWHIECSVMSKKHLGKTFDIHGGGKDLIFPHHTNEIAQSECAHGGEKYVNYWMHNGFVNVEATEEGGDEHVEEIVDEDGNVVRVQKMSKSLDNFFSIREVLERFSPEALRWFLLTTHYRAPLAFGPRHLEEAERRVQYLYETLEKVAEYVKEFEPRDGDDLETIFSTDDKKFVPLIDFETAMDDDFSTPRALASFYEMLKVANALVSAREKEIIGRKLKAADRARLLTEWQGTIEKMTCILGVGEADAATYLQRQRDLRCRVLGLDAAAIEALVQERFLARQAKDFDRSDALRQQLTEMKVEVRDTPAGSTWNLA
ncbi:MAG: cysteine--tRNA ligase [Myxococcales bacterium]|nr:cysteine--tRNA ligase [Myxococcales bacterium]|tara:strand:- start:696 stop:2276 length:1581 start_codon:yes stop_codon:yes gene_type:complete